MSMVILQQEVQWEVRIEVELNGSKVLLVEKVILGEI